MSQEAQLDSKPRPKFGNRAAARRIARLTAVQALYQMDIAGSDLNTVLVQFVEEPIVPDAGGAEIDGTPEIDPQFFSDLVRGVVKRQREVDPLLDDQLAEGWRLNRVDSTLRALLRAAAFELLARPDVPARVVITEYVDVAHAFFSEDEPGVVNGVLDRLARRFRAVEFGVPAAAPTSPEDGSRGTS